MSYPVRDVGATSALKIPASHSVKTELIRRDPAGHPLVSGQTLCENCQRLQVHFGTAGRGPSPVSSGVMYA